MRLWNRFGVRKNGRRDGGATTRLRLQTLEDRAVPSFGFGSAFGIGGTGSAEVAYGVAVDSAGSRYVSGQFSNTVDFDHNDVNQTNSAAIVTATSGLDAFVAKYASDGSFEWVADLGAGSSGSQIALQGSNVYVPYLLRATSTSPEAAYVSALDTSTGAVNWTTVFSANAQARAVAVSTTGSLYVDGFISSSMPDHAIVERLDPASGNILWTQTNGGGGDALAQQLAVDSAGNVYATGIFDPYDPIYTGPTTFGSFAPADTYGNDAGFIWKLNSSGGTVWAGSFDSTGGTGTYAGTGIYSVRGAAADSSGNIYLAGIWVGGSNNFNPGSGRAVSLVSHGDMDAFILKLSPSTHGAMSLAWAKDIGGSSFDNANAVAVDGSGNVYTTGKFNGTVNFNPNSGTAHNLSGGGIFVSKLDANGNYVAAVGLAGTADGNGQGAGDGITVDGSANVYVTGSFSGIADFDPTSGVYNLTSNGGNDAFVLELTQSGRRPDTGGDPNLGNGPADAGVGLIDSAFEPAESLKPTGVSPPSTATILPSEGDLSFLSVSLKGNSVESQAKRDLRISLDSADSSIATDLPIVWN
jgi:hypothetical protein